MNERIRELAEQSEITQYVAAHNKYLELFAELIVRECAGKVDWILAKGGKTQGDLIKQHFGVEE